MEASVELKPNFCQFVGESERLRYYRIVVSALAVACSIPFILNLIGIKLGLPYGYVDLQMLSRLSPLEQMKLIQQSIIGANFYGLIEWLAAILAMMGVLLSVYYYRDTRDGLVIWLALGLVCAAMWDMVSALLSINYLKSVISQQLALRVAWIIGGAGLSILLLSGGVIRLVKPTLVPVLRIRTLALLLIKVAVIMALLILVAMFYNILEFLPEYDYLPKHFWQKIPMIMYGAGLFLFGYIHSKREDYISLMLLMMCIPGILQELVLQYSPTEPFGNAMYIANYLKIVSYLVPLAMLSHEYNRYYHATVSDINDALEHYQAEISRNTEELKKSNEELDDFCYIVSHDLKEPLRGIRNYTNFLEQDYSDKFDDEGKRMLESITHLSQRMENFLDSLLHYSRAGRVELAIKDTDINMVVDEVLGSLESILEEKKVELRIPHSFPTVTCDHVRTVEVFYNLINNAIKYNDKDHKWIEIGYLDEKQDGKTIFYVRDNGIGIKKDYQDKVFKIFKRLHGKEHFGGGTGSGLTIVKRILERQGNNIWVESEPDKGSTFYFTL